MKSPIRSPGILYLQNPLHPFALNQLLNSTDFSLVDVETLVGCVDTGDWASLLRDDADPAVLDSQTREQASQSLERLCLLAFYLRHHFASLPGSSIHHEDPKEQEDDRMIQDLVSRILRDVSRLFSVRSPCAQRASCNPGPATRNPDGQFV